MRFGEQKPNARNIRGSGGAAAGQSQSAASRADEVRGRRAQRSKEQISKVAARITNPPPARPVTVRKSTRGSVFGGSRGQEVRGQEVRTFRSGRDVHQTIGTQARRQFYLTMDRTAGTEMRLPAVPMIRPGWRLLSGLLAIVMAVGIYSLWNSPFCQVESVDVEGIQRINPNEIAAKLNLENQSIVAVDPVQAEDTLTAAYPDLINVRVSVSMPNAVTVSAVERQPVLAIKQGDQINLVDASGVLFPARGVTGKLVTILADNGLPLAPAPLSEAAQATQDAAAVEGDLSANQAAAPAGSKPASSSSAVPVTAERSSGPVRVDPTVLAALEGLGKQLPAGTQLVYSMKDGLGWQAPEGWQVFIGKNLSDFEAKYNMYQQLAGYLDQEGLKPALVSVEQLNAPYYRLEQ